MAIPDVAGSSQNGRSGDGALNVSLPSGSGFLAIVSVRGDNAATAPSGWTLVDSRLGNADNRTAVYIANSDDSPGTGWTTGSGTESAHVLIVGFDVPIDVDESDSQTTANPQVCPAVTTTVATRVARILTTNGWSAAEPSFNYPAGTSDGVQGFTQNGAGDENEGGSLCAFAGEEQATPGDTGTASYTRDEGSEFAAYTYTVALVGSAVAATGTIAATEGDDTAVLAGEVDNPGVQGAIDATEADDTAVLAGTAEAPEFAGTITATEQDDTASLSGTVTGGATGTITATEADDTASLAGEVDNPEAVDITFTVGTTRVGSFSVGTTRVGSWQVGETVTQRGP